MIKMDIYTEKRQTIKKMRENTSVKIICKGKKLEQVTAYDYLGVIMSNDSKEDMEIANRVQKENRIYYAIIRTIV